MNSTRTVTLELLRHGPAHNQLLSPLTQYLALCGNHSATTVTMPFEHAQLLNRLRALMYKATQEDRKFQLKDLSQIMGNVLGAVPGLIAELAELPGQDSSLTHLRLILSASELALLPFELANAPNGFPGAGQSLALQPQAPLCITREVRRVSNTAFQWPVEPCILFIAASPSGVGNIPLEAHLLGLRKVIDPWVEHDIPNSEQKSEQNNLQEKLSRHMVVLPKATVDSIQRACAEHDFTHVHILAHGIPLPGEEEKRYGLALHSDRDPRQMDVVDGGRLATLLRTYRRSGDNRLSGPAVVTIASCDSGAVGSVIESSVGAGASIAHALHEGGVPLVIAAQFPLSFAASILMAQVLYEGLLWGGDPRTILNDLRWQLKSKLPDSHDWASLVAYAALPADLESQLSRVRIKQAHRSINAALKFMDRVTRNIDQVTRNVERRSMARSAGSARNAPVDKHEDSDSVDPELMKQARRKLADAEGRLKGLLRHTPQDRPQDRSLIYGLLASTRKRDARILFSSTAMSQGLDWERARQSLKQARDYYGLAFKEDRASSWALVQGLALAAVLEGAEGISPASLTMALSLSEEDLYSRDTQMATWACSSLIELHLLQLLMQNDAIAGDAEPVKRIKETAKEYAQRLCKMAPDSFDIYSTRRQLKRYVEWFSEYETGFHKISDVADEIATLLPDLEEQFLQ